MIILWKETGSLKAQVKGGNNQKENEGLFKTLSVKYFGGRSFEEERYLFSW